MSKGLHIPQDLLERALKWALQQRLETLDMESVALYTAKEAAALLKLTPAGFRMIAKDRVEFGPQSKRWSVKEIKTLVESRRVKASNRSARPAV